MHQTIAKLTSLLNPAPSLIVPPYRRPLGVWKILFEAINRWVIIANYDYIKVVFTTFRPLASGAGAAHYQKPKIEG
jgi:hypothetical protein